MEQRAAAVNRWATNSRREALPRGRRADSRAGPAAHEVDGGVTAPPGRPSGRMADEVYDTLLGQLMSLRIVPDSRVTIDALARELGVSQTPIRDALNRMEADGLVVRVPNAGYRIPPQITRARFEDMVEIRLLLEPAAARRAAERAYARSRWTACGGCWRRWRSWSEGDGHLAYGAFGLPGRCVPRPHRRERGQPAGPRGTRPAAHARPPLPARLRHRGDLPGDGRARRGAGRRSRLATPMLPPTRCAATSCCPRDRFRPAVRRGRAPARAAD